MSLEKPEPVKPHPTARNLAPMHIFKAGDYGPDDKWPREKLEQVVRNFDEFQKQHKPGAPVPPAVFLSAEFAKKMGAPPPTVGIGHDEGQEYAKWLLNRTDIPAAGWPSKLWMEGDDLYADVEGMPVEVASLVNSGALPKCSAEFYNEYTDLQSGQNYGPMLRRISLLGGDIPRLKDLARNPVFVHSERNQLAPGASPYVSFFSEVQPAMNPREELLNRLREAGCDVSKITDAVPDEVLQKMVQAFQSKLNSLPAKPETIVTNMPSTSTAAAGMPAPSAPVTANAEDAIKGHSSPPNRGVILFSEGGDPAFVKRADAEDKVEPFDAKNVDHMSAYAEHMKKCYAEATKKYSELENQIKPETTPKAKPDEPKEPSEIGAFSERLAKSEAAMKAQFAAQITALQNQVAKVNSDTLAEQSRLKKLEITTFCERLRDAGKIAPVELDPKLCPGGITIIDKLMMLDDTKKISTFSEKSGDKEVTLRRAEMAALEARPVIRKFSEKISEPTVTSDRIEHLKSLSPLKRTVENKKKVKAEMAAKLASYGKN